MNTKENNPKPLGGKAYGSIPHLPGSNRGPSDRGVSEKEAETFLTRRLSRYHIIHVQCKLDGSCVGVHRTEHNIMPLMRAGYECATSPYTQHHHFADWVGKNKDRFMAMLKPGERAMGEWLEEAHGTRYDLNHEPFVLFDIMTGSVRTRVFEVMRRAQAQGFVSPHILHTGAPITIAEIVEKLKTPYHGELDPVEGAVWRIELGLSVQSLAKYVRPDMQPGKYFEHISGNPTVYNWRPDHHAA